MSIDIQSESRTDPKPKMESSPATLGNKATGSSAWKTALILLAVLGAVVATAMFALPSGSDGPELLTYTVEKGDLVVSVVEQGTLESSSNTEIKCRVKGGSTVLWVIESGTEVKPGDVLVRLDQSTIEDNISQQKITYELAVSNKATSQTDVAVAKIGVTEYLEGTFRSEQTTKRKDVVIAESNLKSAQNSLEHAQKMFRKGYTSKLDLESQKDAVKHSELELEVAKTDLEALERFTKAKQLEELKGLLSVAKARLASDEASLDLERARLERAEDQLKNCIIVAETAGMVIHPSAAEWKETPDIEEGAAVREDQVLLVIPDLGQMQVKVGIHESKVDRLRVGMPARVQLQNSYVNGEISEIASITKGGGWWTGNLVKYDTVIKLQDESGLKPGMSVSVEVFLAKHSDVVTVPVAAVLELSGEFCCWIDNGTKEPERRVVKVGDSNDTFIVIQDGIREGEKIVLNPRDFVSEAQAESLQSIDQRASPENVPEFDSSKAKKPQTGENAEASGKAVGGARGNAKSKSAITGARILEQADKNKDGGLSIDEVDAKSKGDFDKNDSNGDGKLDEAELNAVIKREAKAKK